MADLRIREGQGDCSGIRQKIDSEVFLLTIIEQHPHYEVNIGGFKKAQTEKKKE